MAMKSKSRRPVGRQAPTPRRRGKAALTPALALQHERDESVNATAVKPDPTIVQAKRDIDRGLVATAMPAAPGLDAGRRAKRGPGPGGKPASPPPHSLAQQKSDFTAEGSPPPGKVSTTPPARATEPGPPKR